MLKTIAARIDPEINIIFDREWKKIHHWPDGRSESRITQFRLQSWQ